VDAERPRQGVRSHPARPGAVQSLRAARRALASQPRRSHLGPQRGDLTIQLSVWQLRQETTCTTSPTRRVL
jgi:hypothetical protein